MEKFLEESVNFDHKYKCGAPKKTIKRQPQPFTTSTLQQKASNELHFSLQNRQCEVRRSCMRVVISLI